jgi:hypothetical protein
VLRYQGNPNLLRALDHRADSGTRTVLNGGNAFRWSASFIVAGRLSRPSPRSQNNPRLWAMNQVGGVSEVLSRAAPTLWEGSGVSHVSDIRERVHAVLVSDLVTTASSPHPPACLMPSRRLSAFM